MCSFCSKSKYIKQNKIKTQGWGCSALACRKLQLPRTRSLLSLPRKESINTRQQQQSGGHLSRIKHLIFCPLSSTQRRADLHVCSYRSATLRHGVLGRSGVRTWNWTVARCSFCVLKEGQAHSDQRLSPVNRNTNYSLHFRSLWEHDKWDTGNRSSNRCRSRIRRQHASYVSGLSGNRLRLVPYFNSQRQENNLCGDSRIPSWRGCHKGHLAKTWKLRLKSWALERGGYAQGTEA